MVQKCLLTKYRETRPQPVQPLCAVLEDTLDTLLQLADDAVSVESALQKSACALSCAVQLLHCCLRCVISCKSASFLHEILEVHLLDLELLCFRVKIIREMLYQQCRMPLESSNTLLQVSEHA